MDSNLPLLYGCSICEHKTNSVFDLKNHLIKVHVKEETSSPRLRPTVNVVEHFEICKSEVVQRRKESDIKVKEEPVEDLNSKNCFGHPQGSSVDPHKDEIEIRQSRKSMVTLKTYGR